MKFKKKYCLSKKSNIRAISCLIKLKISNILLTYIEVYFNCFLISKCANSKAFILIFSF